MERYMKASKIVGWKKKRDLSYPTREQVFAETDTTKLLEWYRFLDDPKNDEESMVISALQVRLEALWNE